MTEAILHAYLTIDYDGALAAAEAADAALTRGEDWGPLHGIPMALKDNMVHRGAGDHLLLPHPLRMDSSLQRHRGRAAPAGRSGDRWQDQPR